VKGKRILSNSRPRHDIIKEKGVVDLYFQFDITELSYDPIKTIQKIKEQAYDHERWTMEEYLTLLGQNLWKFHSIGVHIKGETLEEKCRSMVAQLIGHGFIKVA
jgi:hypothetical protein